MSITQQRRSVPVVDPQVEADIEAFHRGRERRLCADETHREPILPADSPEIGRELQIDLFSGLMQGAF